MADYSAALLRALEPLGRVKINSADADVLLYHAGNNGLHRAIYQRALQHPGVVVLHDAVLQHFFLGGSEREYLAEFVYNYGPWSEDLARELWRRRARSMADPEYFRYPMIRRVAERAKAVIVHNPRAAQLVQEHAREATVYEIPHLFAPPADLPSASDAIRWRSRLGIAGHTFLVGVFGHLRESKRLLAVLRAFHRARRSADMALLVAGDYVSSDLARAAEPLLGNDPKILRLGHLEERDFWRCASAVDACVNLRYPMAGETSGIAIRLMGIGKAVLVSSGAETSRFPDAACVRIDPGEAEEEMLVDYLVWLATRPDDCRAIGQRAAAHIREHHAPARAARLYWQALQACYDRSSAAVV